MASLLARAKSVRERLYPVLKESAYLERGVLTPEEFVAAGDELVYKCPTWSWSGGDADKRKNYLPEKKQFLVTNNVPCRERAAAMEKVDVDDVLNGGGDDDDWIAPALQEGGQQHQADFTTISSSTADEEEDLADDDAATASDKILYTRTYDLTITYDKYWQTPRMWFYGYDEHQKPLTQSQVFEDIVLDYARRTVTFETHPHLPLPHASIHPCKHPQAMKRIIDHMTNNGKTTPPRPDQAMFIFLKFLQSVVPTINYDYTLDAVLS